MTPLPSPDSKSAELLSLWDTVLGHLDALRQIPGLEETSRLRLDAADQACRQGRQLALQSQSTPKVPAPTVTPAAESVRPRVLVMDDEPEIGNLLQRLFNRSGYETVAVYDGAAAITAFVEARDSGQPFDLVMMDLTIPGGMGGQETIAQLRTLAPTVPCLAASGFADEEHAALHTYGFQAFVAKPFDIAHLRQVVAKLLDHA